MIRIGERVNVRGSKKVRDAVECDDEIQMEVLEEVVEEQVKDLGIDIIDVCMDSNIVETEKVLPQAIYELTSNFKGVMCIDSFSVEALQTAIESYPGRPIINSISLEEYKKGVSKLDAVLSQTHQHNPAYVALVNGPEGPGQTADEKYDLAAEIVKQGGKPEENAVYNKLQAEIAQDGLKIQERELKLQKQSSPFFSEARKNIKAELKENKRQQRDSTFLGKMVNLMTADLKFTKGSASQDEEGKKEEERDE